MSINIYFMYLNLGPIAESPKPSPVPSISSLKDKIRSPFGKGKENTRKIQLMLEETLTKNVQLQRVRRSNVFKKGRALKRTSDFFPRALVTLNQLALNKFNTRTLDSFCWILSLQIVCPQSHLFLSHQAPPAKTDKRLWGRETKIACLLGTPDAVSRHLREFFKSVI